MIKFYSNRELSEKLGIKLAKWKRWSRELLPPDPLGGLQSGYARQYNPADAFMVYLGGCLIGDLKYTIPECKQILTDLHDWLIRNGFLFEPQSGSNPDTHYVVQAYQIFIKPKVHSDNILEGFQYMMRGIIKTERIKHKGFCVNQEFQYETILPEGQTLPSPYMWHHARLLNISAIHTHFTTSLDLIQNNQKT